jgi:hypothetical protein
MWMSTVLKYQDIPMLKGPTAQHAAVMHIILFKQIYFFTWQSA